MQWQNLSSLLELILSARDRLNNADNTLFVSAYGRLCLLSPSTMSALAKESCPLHPDSCSLNKEEWPWTFPNCIHIHHLSVRQRTPAIPTLSGETSVVLHQAVRLLVFQLHSTNSTQLRELTQNKTVLESLLLHLISLRLRNSVNYSSYSIFNFFFLMPISI